jgi:transposase-like protein
VALEAVKGEKIVAHVASGEYGVHPMLVIKWKEHMLNLLPELFSDLRKGTAEERAQKEEELYRQIGQLRVENDWLKKISFLSIERGDWSKRTMRK